jgi:hypothetical protein
VLVGLLVALIFRQRLFGAEVEATLVEMERERRRGRVELGTEVSGA